MNLVPKALRDSKSVDCCCADFPANSKITCTSSTVQLYLKGYPLGEIKDNNKYPFQNQCSSFIFSLFMFIHLISIHGVFLITTIYAISPSLDMRKLFSQHYYPIHGQDLQLGQEHTVK